MLPIGYKFKLPNYGNCKVVSYKVSNDKYFDYQVIINDNTRTAMMTHECIINCGEVINDNQSTASESDSTR